MPAKYVDCPMCGNENCLIKKHSNVDAIQPFLKQKNTFSCRDGQQFILEGAPVNGLYFIHHGYVKVYKLTANNDSQIEFSSRMQD